MEMFFLCTIRRLVKRVGVWSNKTEHEAYCRFVVKANDMIRSAISCKEIAYIYEIIALFCFLEHILMKEISERGIHI